MKTRALFIVVGVSLALASASLYAQESIRDLAFNQQGQIFVLIDVSDGRLVPVPWRLADLASAKGRRKIVFNVSGEAIRQAPVVTNDQWGELDNPNFTQGILAYYHNRAIAASGAAAAPGGTTQDQGTSQDSQPAAQPSDTPR